MRSISEEQFLAWALDNGIILDPKYPQSASLIYGAAGMGSRFWCVPPRPEQRPFFIKSLLELMGEWRDCRVWRLGNWSDSAIPERINDVIESRILKGLGLPLGTADVVIFGHNEIDTLVTLIFVTTIFGWSVGEDLYIVPDDSQCIMKVSHHEVIHVTARMSSEIDRWVSGMEDRKFLLPENPPDATFKRPDWMKRSDE